MHGPIDIITMRRGYHRDLTRQTTWVARHRLILLRSTNTQWRATSESRAVRIACPNFAELLVGVSCGLLDWERIRGWTARLTMTEEEFDQALNALSRDNCLKQVAARSGFLPDPQDAVQDVLLTFSRMQPHQYEHIRDLKPYVEEAVRRRAIRLAVTSKDKTWPHVKLDGDEARQLEQTSFQDPYESYKLEQTRQFMHIAIDLLDPLERAIARALLNGDSGPTIASRTDLTIDDVRGARKRGLEKLKKFFLDLMREERRRDRDDP